MSAPVSLDCGLGRVLSKGSPDYCVLAEYRLTGRGLGSEVRSVDGSGQEMGVDQGGGHGRGERELVLMCLEGGTS